jgi:hypothetical protein
LVAILFAIGNGLMWPSFISILSKRAGYIYQGAIQGLASSFGSLAKLLDFLLNLGSSSEINNHIVCEAVGCYSIATNKISVKVGSRGTIFLFVCNECKPKFCVDPKIA